MDFGIGCSLDYHAHAPAALVFNLEAATLPRQRLRSESLIAHPPIQPERWTAPDTGNRFLRFVVPPGSFRLDYRADVTLDPLMEDPASVGEFLAQDLPAATLQDLYASRYCQSDKLSPLRHPPVRRRAERLPAGHGDLQLDLRQRRLHQRQHGRADLRVRHRDPARRGVPGLRPSRHRAVPGRSASPPATSAPTPGAWCRPTSTRCSRRSCTAPPAAHGTCSTPRG